MNKNIFERKGISLERLDLLCRVANQGGIKRAVGDDPARQSLASRQLKELSECIGAELFQRRGRHLELTDTGNTLNKICTSFFAQLETFLQTTRNQPTCFTLGVGDSIFQWQILPRMKDFQAQFSNIQLQSFSYSATEIIHRVETNALDAGIVRTSALTKTMLSFVEIGEVRYRLFVPTCLIKSPIQRKALSNFADIPLCNLIGNGTYATNMTHVLEAFGRTAALSCSSATQMYAAVESGQYAAVLPEKAASSLDKARFQAFTFPEMASFTRKIALVYKEDTMANEHKSAVMHFLSQILGTN